MGTINSTKIVKCPECNEPGIFNINHGTSYRIGHNYKNKEGVWKKQWHTIGTVKKDLKKIKNFSLKYPHVIDPKIIENVDRTIQNGNLLANQEGLIDLISALKKAAHKIEDFWAEFSLDKEDVNNNYHDLVKGLVCPHCENEIQIRYKRLGPPHQPVEILAGPKNRLEKRTSGYTSWFNDGEVKKGKKMK